jgi:hypothetical protein
LIRSRWWTFVSICLVVAGIRGLPGNRMVAQAPAKLPDTVTVFFITWLNKFVFGPDDIDLFVHTFYCAPLPRPGAGGGVGNPDCEDGIPTRK